MVIWRGGWFSSWQLVSLKTKFLLHLATQLECKWKQEECCSQSSVAASEKLIPRSILLRCRPPLRFCSLPSATFWIHASRLSPSFVSLCICSLFLLCSTLSLYAFCSPCLIWAFLSSPSRQNNPRPLWTATPSARTHTLMHTLPSANHTQEMGFHAQRSLPGQWNPRMEFQALKCSLEEEIEHDLSLPPSFIVLKFLSCFTRHDFSTHLFLWHSFFPPHCIWMHQFCLAGTSKSMSICAFPRWICNNLSCCCFQSEHC